MSFSESIKPFSYQRNQQKCAKWLKKNIYIFYFGSIEKTFWELDLNVSLLLVVLVILPKGECFVEKNVYINWLILLEFFFSDLFVNFRIYFETMCSR